LWELALASGKGIVVDPTQIHLLPETEVICRALDLDPLGLIASGALLVAASPEESPQMVESLAAADIKAWVIGRVVNGPAAVKMETPDGLVPMPAYERDELARLFESPA
jgi:hydrogenase expression/formation protein HypE